jgi:hypothetical protein
MTAIRWSNRRAAGWTALAAGLGASVAAVVKENRGTQPPYRGRYPAVAQLTNAAGRPIRQRNAFAERHDVPCRP